MSAQARAGRAATSKETVAIITELLHYASPNGTRIDLAPAMAACTDASTCYTGPQDPHFPKLKVPKIPAEAETPTPEPRPQGCRVEVVREGTLSAARRLVLAGHANTLILNFASARNPGGGFLNGSLAQEESIAMCSGLYPCLTKHSKSYYAANNSTRDGLYTDHLIYSPGVPVIREDVRDYPLLDRPYKVAVITLPAPNAGEARKKGAGEAEIRATIERRVQMVLEVAAAHGHSTLVLGAFGCGVFKNNAGDVADAFRRALCGGGGGAGAARHFQHVCFAVLEKQGQGNVAAFEKAFGGRAVL